MAGGVGGYGRTIGARGLSLFALFCVGSLCHAQDPRETIVTAWEMPSATLSVPLEGLDSRTREIWVRFDPRRLAGPPDPGATAVRRIRVSAEDRARLSMWDVPGNASAGRDALLVGRATLLWEEATGSAAPPSLKRSVEVEVHPPSPDWLAGQTLTARDAGHPGALVPYRFTRSVIPAYFDPKEQAWRPFRRENLPDTESGWLLLRLEVEEAAPPLISLPVVVRFTRAAAFGWVETIVAACCGLLTLATGTMAVILWKRHRQLRGCLVAQQSSTRRQADALLPPLLERVDDISEDLRILLTRLNGATSPPSASPPPRPGPAPVELTSDSSSAPLAAAVITWKPTDYREGPGLGRLRQSLKEILGSGELRREPTRRLEVLKEFFRRDTESWAPPRDEPAFLEFRTADGSRLLLVVPPQVTDGALGLAIPVTLDRTRLPEYYRNAVSAEGSEFYELVEPCLISREGSSWEQHRVVEAGVWK